MNSFIPHNRLRHLRRRLRNLTRNTLRILRRGSRRSLSLILNLHRLNEHRANPVRTLFLDEFNERFDRSVTGVFFGGGFVAGGIEFDGGESADVVGDVVCCCVAFGDDDFVGVGGVCGGELFVFRSEVLAVAALRLETWTRRG